MHVMQAQAFVDLIANSTPTSYAVARFDQNINRELLLISTRINPQIKVIYRKAFSLMPDGTVFFDVHPLTNSAWYLDADLIVELDKKVIFDSSVSNNATKLFEIVQLNVAPDVMKRYTENSNEIRVAQTLMPTRSSC